MVVPVGDGRLFTGQDRQLAVNEIAEIEPRGVDISSVAEHEIHRHVERIIAVTFVAKAVVEHERQHPGAMRIGVFPDVAAKALETIGPAFGKRRIGEQGGGDRLKREADAKLLHHVGLARIIEIDLDGASAQHHVEPELADPRHVIEHDLVAAFGHDRQFGAALVGPHAEPEEAQAQFIADRLALHEVPPALRAAFVEVGERRPRQFELSRGLKADRAVRAGQCDDLAALLDRSPTKFSQAKQQLADPARLVPARRAVIVEAIDELLMLGPDPPIFARLLAAGKDRNQIGAGFDERRSAKIGSGCHSKRA